MKPELYVLLKLKLNHFIEKKKDGRKTLHWLKNDIKLSKNEIKEFSVKQQYNHLFRILKNKNRIKDNIVKDVIFIDCKNSSNYQEELDGIIRNGIVVNGVSYKYWGKSASMSRTGILGFISNDMYNTVESYAMMDIKLDKVVLSKFESYKCLLLSSCFCVEDKIPYMIVVDDYYKTIKNIDIKYVDEKDKEYIDSETKEQKTFKEKTIKTGKKDIDICVNDGAGLVSKEYSEYLSKYLELDYNASVFMLRLPYVKGLAVNIDFKSYYKEKNIHIIKDIWGKEHSVSDIDIILTKSQYKGFGYFKKDNNYNDWINYNNLLNKYNYCIGISKVNYSYEKEPRMTRVNYQTLQTLDITVDDMIELSSYTRDWVSRILNGDINYIYKYLGISENTTPSNIYMKCVLLNPYMIHDIKIKSYLFGLLKKTINEIKIGKLYVNGAFKFLLPDMIFMLEYIGNLEPVGCLEKGEMFAKKHNGNYILNRNPHLSKYEHIVLNAVNNEQTKKWLSHLDNVCMINSYDVTAPSMNGADFDGDLVMVHNNEIYFKGLSNEKYIVLDIEDKITAKEEEYKLENIIEFTKSSLDSRIGEISNCASTYCNKNPKTDKDKEKYDDILCLLSVINGKEIDKCKTGVRWNVPRNIQRNAKPLPYFLKYKYPKQTKHNLSKTKMNEHCWFVEKWEKDIKWNREFINTSEFIIDKNIPFIEEKYKEVVKMFKEYYRDYSENKNFENMCKKYDKYKNEFIDMNLTKKDVENFEIDWDKFYLKYKNKFLEIVPNQAELANYLVDLTYNKMKGLYYNQMWKIVEEGILINLRSYKDKNLKIKVPKEIGEGDFGYDFEYLGRYYKNVDYQGVV